MFFYNAIILNKEIHILTLFLFSKRYYHFWGSLAVFESLHPHNIILPLIVQLLAINLEAKIY
jgi:hypothetical protein